MAEAMRRGVLTLTFVLGVFAASGPAEAHPLDPALLELSEGAAGDLEVVWRVPAARPRDAPLEPILPPCAPTAPPTVQQDAHRIGWRVTLDCADVTLDGQRVGVDGLDARQSDALLRFAFADGEVAQVVLRGGESTWRVTRAAGAWARFRSYFVLGIEHILSGLDHLLFVLGLLFLVRDGRSLVVTITAFTFGHSVTLSLATLGWLRLPSAPVEVAIAFSIWLLAVALAGRPRRREARPWPLAAVFGLLHGLGFAGALAETGLPETEIPVALVSFNLGIEAGQLAFVAAVLALLWRPGRGVRPLTERLTVPAAYLIGSLASYWMLDRGWTWLVAG